MRTIFTVLDVLLAVIFIESDEVLYGGLGYGTLQPDRARMRMASLPRLNYSLFLCI